MCFVFIFNPFMHHKHCKYFMEYINLLLEICSAHLVDDACGWAMRVAVWTSGKEPERWTRTSSSFCYFLHLQYSTLERSLWCRLYCFDDFLIIVQRAHQDHVCFPNNLHRIAFQEVVWGWRVPEGGWKGRHWDRNGKIDKDNGWWRWRKTRNWNDKLKHFTGKHLRRWVHWTDTHTLWCEREKEFVVKPNGRILKRIRER